MWWSGGQDWIGYLRPDQFLDHHMVIIIDCQTKIYPHKYSKISAYPKKIPDSGFVPFETECARSALIF